MCPLAAVNMPRAAGLRWSKRQGAYPSQWPRTPPTPIKSSRFHDPFQLLVGELAEIGSDGDLVLLRRLAPAAAGLHPEDGGGDALRAFGGGLAEQALGNLGGRLDLAGVEFVAVVLAERLRVDGEDTGDIGSPERRSRPSPRPGGGGRVGLCAGVGPCQRSSDRAGRSDRLPPRACGAQDRQDRPGKFTRAGVRPPR